MAEKLPAPTRIRIIWRFICRGWRVLAELHTAHWLIFDILGFSVIPSNITSAVASVLIGGSSIVILLVFVVTLVAVFTGISLWRLADIGKQNEHSLPIQIAAAPIFPKRQTWWHWLGLGLAIGVSLWVIPNIRPSRSPNDPYEGRPLAIAWSSSRLVEDSRSTINAFIVDAHNQGPNEVTVHDAYMLSLIDSTRIPMHIVNPPSERIPVSVAMPVPRNA
jgi:hypothetical protein